MPHLFALVKHVLYVYNIIRIQRCMMEWYSDNAVNSVFGMVVLRGFKTCHLSYIFFLHMSKVLDVISCCKWQSIIKSCEL